MEGRKLQRRRSWFVFDWEASVAARRLFSSRGEWGSSLVSKPGLLLCGGFSVVGSRALELRPSNCGTQV